MHKRLFFTVWPRRACLCAAIQPMRVEMREEHGQFEGKSLQSLPPLLLPHTDQSSDQRWSPLSQRVWERQSLSEKSCTKQGVCYHREAEQWICETAGSAFYIRVCPAVHAHKQWDQRETHFQPTNMMSTRMCIAQAHVNAHILRFCVCLLSIHISVYGYMYQAHIYSYATNIRINAERGMLPNLLITSLCRTGTTTPQSAHSVQTPLDKCPFLFLCSEMLRRGEELRMACISYAPSWIVAWLSRMIPKRRSQGRLLSSAPFNSVELWWFEWEWPP